MKLRNDLKYVVVEGVIGSGKTSFVEILGAHLNARVVLEPVEENPFLVKFYSDRKRYSFQTQLYFLLSRFKQQQEIASQTDLFHSLVLSDYYFVKDKIFASVNLDAHELQLYHTVSSILEPQIVRPDLVIYLQTSTSRLMKNIRTRNREYEKTISEQYLRELTEAYNHFFFYYQETPLLIVDVTNMDLVNNLRDIDEIVGEINKTRIKGTHFFRPLTREQGQSTII